MKSLQDCFSIDKAYALRTLITFIQLCQRNSKLRASFYDLGDKPMLLLLLLLQLQLLLLLLLLLRWSVGLFIGAWPCEVIPLWDELLGQNPSLR